MKILIGGDSWGCGEWTKKDPAAGYRSSNYFISHKGLEQYFLDDGYEVINASKGGCSNKESIKRISENIISDIDYIIWFQSDPLRDLYPFFDFVKKFNSYSELVDLNNNLLDNNYNELNKIGRNIFCLGGCSKINSDLIKKYNNLTPLIYSVTEFLLPDYKHPEIWHSNWHPQIDKIKDIKILVKLLACKRKQDALYTNKKYQNLFYPDGSHPNRYGHYKVYEYIKNYCI